MENESAIIKRLKKNKWKNLNTYGYSKEVYGKLKESIVFDDKSMDVLFLQVFLVVMMLFTVFAQFGVVKTYFVSKYLAFFIISAIMNLVWWMKTNVTTKHMQWRNRMVAIIFLAFGIVESVYDKNVVATAILVLYCITAMMYLDTMINYTIMLTISSGIFIYTSYMIKDADIASGDTVNIFTYMIVSIPIHYISQSRRINSFIIQKQLEDINRELSPSAMIDELSGVLNRATFDDITKKVLANPHDEMYLCVLDIDNFKKTNDRGGHKVGDNAIESLAAAVAEAIDIKSFNPSTLKQQLIYGNSNYIGRLGGDEFFVVIREKVRNETIEETLTFLVNAVRAIELDGGVKITCSLGAIKVGKNNHDYEKLYRAADKVLYLVKENGKDGFKIKDYENMDMN